MYVNAPELFDDGSEIENAASLLLLFIALKVPMVGAIVFTVNVAVVVPEV